MVGAHDEHARLAPERFGAHARRQPHRPGGEDDVDPPAFEFVGDVEEAEPAHLDARLRDRLHRGRDRRRRQGARTGRDDADPQHRRVAVATDRSAPAEQLIVVVLHAAGERKQLAPVGGELDLARAAIEELDVELLLEPADLLTQRRAA